MEDTTKASSCLAITEKKTHKPGGCVGIFFQLFDWNRRLAKKKLFPRKLLPPARAKQVSKRFKGDEKMPISKVQWIEGENSGGFPNVKRDGNNGLDLVKKIDMRAPGLVARLMGLESMPVVNRDKPKKAPFSAACNNGYDKEDLNVEKGSAKIESRPQKLQKTGPSEKKAVARFGNEALQFKSVLSRSSKHQHPRKLPSPVKSPCFSSGRNAWRTSRLIDAATRILEPGLQATNKAKCTITYSNSINFSGSDKVEETEVVLPDNYNTSDSFVGQTSCKNCDNYLNVGDFDQNMEEQPSVSAPPASNSVNVLPLESVRSKISSPMLSQEREVVLLTRREPPLSLAGQESKGNLGSLREMNPFIERIPLERQSPVRSSPQRCKPKTDESSSVAFKQRNPSQNQLSERRDRISPKSKASNLRSEEGSSSSSAVSETKDFVTLNRNLCSRSRLRVPNKVDNSKFDGERKAFKGYEDPLPHVRTSLRKRRTINVSGPAENRDFMSLTTAKQRNLVCSTLTRKRPGLDQPTKRSCNEGRVAGQGDGRRVYGNGSDIISFAFNSPTSKRTPIPSGFKEKSLENQRSTSLQKQLAYGGDTIGVLLQQKLRELTSQEDDELMSGAAAKRSTAMILQELIAALTTEETSSCDGSLHIEMALSAEAKIERSVKTSKDVDHFSPGSVLDASFSSSSVDDGSGSRFLADYMDYSMDHLQLFEPDADPSDSATSINNGKTGSKMMTELFNHASSILQSIYLTGVRLTGSKLTHAEEVLLNTELLFGNVTKCCLDNKTTKGLLAVPAILDELEIVAREMWMTMNVLVNTDNSKEWNQLKGFMFDSLVEYLDCKYSKVCNTGFKAWRRLPSRLNPSMVFEEVEEEIKRWGYFGGMSVNEVLEWEMSNSLGKWTDFNIEAFESGVDIECNILQVLVEEIVVDLQSWKC